MGTNFYVYHHGAKIHIGKLSAVYRFRFHGYPTLRTVDDWVKFLMGKIIHSSDGKSMNWIEFLKIVLSRSKEKQNEEAEHHFYADFDFNEFR